MIDVGEHTGGDGSLRRERGALVRSPAAADVAVLALALAVRLSLYPWFHSLILAGDEFYYWKTARKGFLDLQMRMPLWSGVLSVVRHLSDHPAAARVLVVLIGSLSAALVCRLARRLYGPRVGLVAGLVAAFHPELVMWSHYVWSEMLYGLLVLASCLAFFPRSPEDPPGVARAGAGLGLALLTKEFAVIPFAAFCVALFVGRANLPPKRLALGALLFLLPLATYMAAYRVHNGTPFWPHRAAVGNFRQSVGLPASEEKADESYLERVDTRSARGLAQRTADSLSRLWGSQSFPIWRLSARSARPNASLEEAEETARPDGDYRLVPPRWLVLGFVACHALVLLAGVVGLVGSQHRTFKTFALSSVAFLSLAAIPSLLVSRFRVPFLFLFVIEAARLLADPRAAAGVFADRRRSIAAVLMVAVFSLLLLGNLDSLSSWG